MITFTAHAQKQLKEWGIARKHIAETLNHPLKTIRQSSLRYRAVGSIRKNRKEYLLVVIYDKINGTKEIITAFITKKFKKYL